MQNRGVGVGVKFSKFEQFVLTLVRLRLQIDYTCHGWFVRSVQLQNFPSLHRMNQFHLLCLQTIIKIAFNKQNKIRAFIFPNCKILSLTVLNSPSENQEIQLLERLVYINNIIHTKYRYIMQLCLLRVHASDMCRGNVSDRYNTNDICFSNTPCNLKMRLWKTGGF